MNFLCNSSHYPGVIGSGGIGEVDSLSEEKSTTYKFIHQTRDDQTKIYSIYGPKKCEMHNTLDRFDRIQIICAKSVMNRLKRQLCLSESQYISRVHQSHSFIKMRLEFTDKKCKTLNAIHLEKDNYYIEQNEFFQVITRIVEASTVVVARYKCAGESEDSLIRVGACNLKNNADPLNFMLDQLQKISKEIELFIIKDKMLPDQIEKTIFNLVEFYKSTSKCQIVVLDKIEFIFTNQPLVIVDKQTNPIILFGSEQRSALGLIPSPLFPFNYTHYEPQKPFFHATHTSKRKNVKIISIHSPSDPLHELHEKFYKFQIIIASNIQYCSNGPVSEIDKKYLNIILETHLPIRIITKIKDTSYKKRDVCVKEDKYFIPKNRFKGVIAKVDASSVVVLFRSYFSCGNRNLNKCSIWNFRNKVDTLGFILNELKERSNFIDIFLVSGKEVRPDKLESIYNTIELLNGNDCPMIIQETVQCIFEGMQAKVFSDLANNPVISFQP